MKNRSKDEIQKDHWFYIIFFVVIIELAGVTLSEMNYSAQSDEIFSLKLIQHPWAEMLRVASEDVHPPLFYIIVKAFTDCFGGGDPYRNIIIAKIISILPLWLLLVIAATVICKQDGRCVAILFAEFIIGFPSIIHISSLIRMYSWGLLFVTITGMSAVSVMRDWDNQRTWIIFCFSSIAACYTHYYCDISVFYIYIFLLIYMIKKKKPVKRLLIQGGIVVISFLPWLGVLMNQAKTVSEDYWIQKIDFATILDYIKFYFAPYTDVRVISIPLEIFMITIAVVITIRSFCLKHWDTLFLLSIAISVAITGILVSWMSRPVFVARYVLPSCGLFLLGIAYEIAQILPKFPHMRPIPEKITGRYIFSTFTLATTLIVSLIDILSFSKNEIKYGENFEKIRAELISPIQKMEKTDENPIIITDSSYLQLALSYYIPEVTIYSVGIEVTDYTHELSVKDNISEYQGKINTVASPMWLVHSANAGPELLDLANISNVKPVLETLEQEDMVIYCIN